MKRQLWTKPMEDWPPILIEWLSRREEMPFRRCVRSAKGLLRRLIEGENNMLRCLSIIHTVNHSITSFRFPDSSLPLSCRLPRYGEGLPTGNFISPFSSAFPVFIFVCRRPSAIVFNPVTLRLSCQSWFKPFTHTVVPQPGWAWQLWGFANLLLPAL